MNILITGGTGFLGSELIDYFSNQRKKRKSDKVYAIYRSEPGKGKAEWIKLDLISDDYQKYEMLKIDVVIHAGGASPNRAYKDGSFDATIVGTRKLLDFAKKIKVKKFIFISSTSAILPKIGPYGKSKILAENEVIASGLNYTIIRPDTIVGKGVDFMRVCEMLKTKKFFPMIGNGNNQNQPIDVHDLIKIIEMCIDAKKSRINSDKKTLIAVGSEKITTKDMIKRIAKIQGNEGIKTIGIPYFLVLGVSYITNLIYPKLGINPERVRIMVYSRDFKSDFDIKYKTFDEMIGFLKN